MNPSLTLEERITLLERQMADVRQRLPRQETTREWLQRISGSFKVNPDFEEIVRYGQEFREADRPKDDESEEG